MSGPTDWSARVGKLADLLGKDNVSNGESDRRLHGEDLTFHAEGLPDVVTWPRTTADVAAVLALATTWNVPVVPFGAGTSVEGHIVALKGGIAVDLSRMDRILEVDEAALTATVQAGVTRLALEQHLGYGGLRFTVDPGADATLGGMAATNAAGTRTVRYGKTRPNVLALEAVLSSGRVIRTGSRAMKSSAGYDLTGLLVGSEGTLAIITELTLKLHPIPEHTVVAQVSFATTEAAARAAVDVVGAGIAVSRLELLDERVVTAVNEYADAGLAPGGLLIAELEGSQEAVDAELLAFQQVVAEGGAIATTTERDPTRRNRLWKVRHDVFFALKLMAPGRASLSTDTCVPLSALSEHVVNSDRLLRTHGLVGGLVGHAGDGNVHVCLLVNPNDAQEMTRIRGFVDAVVDDALAHGGTCTGEHGVGLGKINALEREHGDITGLMAEIKRVFDPAGVLNPGKVLRTPHG